MLLFRSEEAVDAWCRARKAPRGAMLTVGQVWALARAWYGNRLSPDYHGRSPTEAQAIFAAVGLTGDFWKLSADH
jgi:hypothetical protein